VPDTRDVSRPRGAPDVAALTGEAEIDLPGPAG
jgi:hypothetical protein